MLRTKKFTTKNRGSQLTTPFQSFFTKIGILDFNQLTLFLGFTMFWIFACGNFVEATEVEKEWDVGPTWAVHQTGRPVLYTQNEYQYVLYYDHERYLRLAQRKLGSDEWKEHRFPVQTRWATGGHARLALAVDANGYVHAAPYRRDLTEAPPTPPGTIYYRSQQPHDLKTLERMPMVDRNEPNPGYPTFIEGPEDGLYFEYRIGGSGRGSQRWNVYDLEKEEWEALPILLDGEGERSAYGGPRLGPDGRWHCFWVWRETPDAETTHTAAYMRSENLLDWETAGGEELDLPITADNEKVVVDPVEPRAGLLNSIKGLGWDSRERPILSYHKYDEEGNSQIYNVRFDDRHWHIVQATKWDFRWNFSGRGALNEQISTQGPRPDSEEKLHQRVWSGEHGHQRLVIDELTLEPVSAEQKIEPKQQKEIIPLWQRRRSEPESKFDERPMEVHWRKDKGEAEEPNVEYWLRWETGPRNRDRPVEKPWPDPTTLRVYKVRK